MDAVNAIVLASDFGACVLQSRLSRRGGGYKVGKHKYMLDLSKLAHLGAVSVQRRSDSLLHRAKSTQGPREAAEGWEAFAGPHLYPEPSR